MPQSPDDIYARALAAAGPDGRLPLSRLTAWEIFLSNPMASASLR